MSRVTAPLDLHQLRQSGTILSAALATVAAAATAGTTTAELDRLAEEAIRSRGAEPVFKGYRGFPATLCVSINDEVVHGIPRPDRLLQPGDVVGLDLGVRYQGWVTDAAVTVAIPPVSAAAARLIATTRQALTTALAGLKAGSTVGDIGARIQRTAAAAGLGVVRDLVGHGVGRDLHEEPKIPNVGKAKTGPVLRAGSVIAIEPMLTAGDYRVSMDTDGWTIRTRDRSLAAHFEQTILITEHGAEILTPYVQDPGN